MNRTLLAFLEACVSAMFFIPALAWLHQKRFRELHKTVGYGVFAFYLSAIYSLAGLPQILYFSFDANCNFQPFLYMFSDWRSTGLNVLLFVPLGMMLPLLWADFRPLWKTLLAGFGISFFIETLQLFSLRATDINDLMTNTAGTLVGHCIGRFILKVSARLAPPDSHGDFTLVCLMVLLIMFFLQPFLFTALWELLYGRIPRFLFFSFSSCNIPPLVV